MKRILKTVAWTAGGLLLLLVFLAGFTQTQFFRDRLRATVLSTLDSALIARVELGEVTGNLVTGFSISPVALRVDSGDVVTAERIDIRYDLFRIPGRTVAVERLVLVRPAVHVVRSAAGVWNIDRILRPSPPDTGGSAGPGWSILVGALEIEDGSLALTDSQALLDPRHGPVDTSRVEYHRLALYNLNLRSSLRLSGGELRLAIGHLGFATSVPGLRLQHIGGDVRISPTAADLRNLEIRTDSSTIRIDAALDGANLLGGPGMQELQDADLRLRLRLDDLVFRDLAAFLPEVSFLHGRVDLDLEASGNLTELSVQRLGLLVGGTRLSLAGTLFNLHRTSDLLLQVHIDGRNVSMADVRGLLPEFRLPDLHGLGTAVLAVDFDGEPLDFRTSIATATAAGTAEANVALRIGGPATLEYRAEAKARGVDLGAIFGEPDLASSLNGTVRVEGEGVDLEHLSSVVDAALDSSTFRGRPVAPSTIRVGVDEGRLNGAVDLTLGSMRSALAVRLGELTGPLPTFWLEGSVASFDLRELLPDAAVSTDLTMALRASGVGLTAADVSGDAALDITDSRYGDYRIDSGTVRLVMDQLSRDQKDILIESNIADFRLRGAFELGPLVDLIAFEVNNIGVAIGEKFAALDSSLASTVDRAELAAQRRALARDTAKIDATYLLRIKDLEPLSRVTGNRTFNGLGTLRGSILGDIRNLSLDGRLALRDFFYGNADSGVLLRGANVSFQVTDLAPEQPLNRVEFFASADVDRLHINRRTVDSLELSLRFSQEYATYTARARYDTAFFASFSGITAVEEAAARFTMNRATLAYRDYAWELEGGASAAFSRSGMALENIVLRRDSQEVRGGLVLGADGGLTGTVQASGLDLRGLQEVLPIAGEEGDDAVFSGTVDLRLRAAGTLGSPRYAADVEILRGAFRGIPFGTVRGDLSYADRLLTMALSALTRDGLEEGGTGLRAIGTVPVNLDLAAREEEPVRPPMDLRLRARNLPMAVLDPLVPTFNQLNGLLSCDLTLRGPVDDPEIAGDFAIDSCSFLFTPNNIAYRFEGRFRPEGGRIQVLEAIVRNADTDRKAGRTTELRITGDFALREFVPADFRLTGRGGLLVVRESTRKTSLSVYGDLYVETEDAGLRFTGNIPSSLLQGSVMVKNSTLIFPPTQGAADAGAERRVRVVVFDDTSRTDLPEEEALTRAYFGGGADTAAAGGAERPGSVSFLDGLRYDLEIEARTGGAEIRMVFNPLTGEELVANIDGRFAILGDRTTWIGTVAVERAYYNFAKRFDATGTLRYTGDFQNPELDITATYTGSRSRRDSLAGQIREDVRVILKISGTRMEPKLEISMTIDGVDYAVYGGPKSSDVGSDAIQFLITGNFPLTESQKNDIAADIGGTVGTSLVTGATSLLSSQLSDFLRRETGFINSIEIGYGAGSTFGEAADIRVSGTVGDGLWRIGGRVLDDPFNNANLSLLYSFGDIFRNRSLRNFMFELERRVEANVGQINERKEVNSARLFYRFSF